MTHPAHDSHCIFCKIVHGQIPSARVFETDEVVVFLDINPVNPGHTLIVPKAHHAHLDDLPPEVAAHAGSLLPWLCRAVRAATGADGINVIINNGQAPVRRSTIATGTSSRASTTIPSTGPGRRVNISATNWARCGSASNAS